MTGYPEIDFSVRQTLGDMFAVRPTAPDMANPTPELQQAVNGAVHAKIHAKEPTPQQTDLLDAYFDVICGDCEEGRCHWGGQASRDSIAAAQEGREYHGRCGRARHEVSVRWRNPL